MERELQIHPIPSNLVELLSTKIVKAYNIAKVTTCKTLMLPPRSMAPDHILLLSLSLSHLRIEEKIEIPISKWHHRHRWIPD
ncbi:hypothetical protein L1987_55292 [Smallanthus sonchifolius]|uniref:Uncharacterized protein n=1 Tax=Smallanthus sonchifolius TaxID=185202 RepID=A0ACB9E9L3_9ASTR|nr:hypothetical protein L1987_55292 [Smallanthus sonchifolius]